MSENFHVDLYAAKKMNLCSIHVCVFPYLCVLKQMKPGPEVIKLFSCSELLIITDITKIG